MPGAAVARFPHLSPSSTGFRQIPVSTTIFHRFTLGARALELIKAFSFFGVAQIVIQGCAMVSGLFLVRVLPPHEYALFTIANAMLATMSLLADCGVGTGVMAVGGTVWMNREKLGQVFATGLRLRFRFGVVSSMLATPALVYLLWSHGASTLSTAAILFGVLALFAISLSGTLLEIPGKLHQCIRPLVLISLGQALARLAALAASVWLWPLAAVAMAVGCFTQGWANYRMRRVAASVADIHQKGDPVVRAEILKIVKRTFPGVLYYSISGQLPIWLISLFGLSSGVADLGALGRIGQLFTIVTVCFGSIIVPRFARLNRPLPMLRSIYFGIAVAVALIGGLATIFTGLIPGVVLKLLGPSYSTLTLEVVLVVAAAGSGLLKDCGFALAAARGWIVAPLISIPLSIASQATGMAIFDFSSVAGVLWIGIVNNLTTFLVIGTYVFLKTQIPQSSRIQ